MTINSLDPNKNHRVFTGIQLPPDLAGLIEDRMKDNNPFVDALRTVDFKTIHFTLHFFASLTLEKIKELDKVTEEIVRRKAPFELKLEKPGFFPSETRPRVFWWGIAHSDELTALHEDLDKEYAKRGFPLEKRRYVPHLTIGRFKKPVRLQEGQSKHLDEKWLLNGEKFNVAEIRLFKGPAGPDGYETLKIYPLDQSLAIRR